MKTVDLFIPCIIDQFHPETAFSTLKLLRHAGVKVNYNPEQTCCGQYAFNNGYLDDAIHLGEKFLHDFSSNDPVVAPTASCVNYIKKHFAEMFYNTSKHQEYKRLIGNIYELTEFLVVYMNFDNFNADFPYKVAIHDSCSANQLGVKEYSRTLLSKVSGLTIVEMQHSDMCCGFGESFALKHEAVSVAMARHKVNEALEMGAEYITSTDWSCLLHLNAYIQKQKLPLKVIHIADILASGWPE